MSKKQKETMVKLRFWKDWEPAPYITRIHAGFEVEFPATVVKGKRKVKR